VRANQIRASEARTGSTCSPDPREPILTIYSAAVVDARWRLRDSVAPALQNSGRDGEAQGLPVSEPAGVRQLGSASGGVSNAAARIMIAAVTFFTAFALAFVALFLCVRQLVRPGDGEDRKTGSAVAAHGPGSR